MIRPSVALDNGSSFHTKILDAESYIAHAQWIEIAGVLHVLKNDMLIMPGHAQHASCMSKAALAHCELTLTCCKSGRACAILPVTQLHKGIKCTASDFFCMQVAVLQQRLKGALTYGICKNLTEHMIAGYHMRPFPVCINRPVGIGPVAKLPCPGYVGNTAGPTGMMLSIACGTSAGNAYFGLPRPSECSSFMILLLMHLLMKVILALYCVLAIC